MKHVVVGLVAMFLGIWGMIVWFKTFGLVMRGLVPIVFLVFGLVALLSGFRRVATLSQSAAEDDDDDEDDEDDDDEDEDELEEDDDLEEDDERSAELVAADAPAA